MASIVVTPNRVDLINLRCVVFRVGGSYMVSCNGDKIGFECPSDIEPGDTWQGIESAVLGAIRHIDRHDAESPGWTPKS